MKRTFVVTVNVEDDDFFEAEATEEIREAILWNAEGITKVYSVEEEES